MPAAVGFGLGFGLGFFDFFGCVGVAVGLGLGADDVVSATVGGVRDGAAAGLAGPPLPPNTVLPTSNATPTTKISATSTAARRRIWASVAWVPSRRRFGDGTRTSVPVARAVVDADENEEIEGQMARPTLRSRSMLVPDMRRRRRT